MRQDAIFTGLFFVLSATCSVIALNQAGTLFFYQNFTPEVIYAACGLGFQHPGTVPAVLHNFLLVREGSFDCALLDPAAPMQPAGLFARLQLYLSYSIALIWSPPIISYRDLWPLVAVFGGAYGAGVFVLFRLFFPCFPSVLGSLVVAMSPVALTLILSFRDYSKAPFFIWGIVFLIATIRASTVRTACLYALGAGVVTGLGFGFRVDLAVIIPIGVVALFAARRWGDLGLRIPAIIVFGVTSFFLAWPAASASNGSSFGSVIMQGMSDPFQRFLGTGRSPYSLGARYSDELVLSSISAAERPKMPMWDDNEGVAVYGISQAMKLSGQNALAWMPLFMGDIATQGLKSLFWLSAMPAMFAPDRPGDPGFGSLIVSTATAPGNFFYALVAHQWLVVFGIAGVAAFCLREVALRHRYFLGTALLIGLLAASTTAQFSVRHIFYLEFIWVFAMTSLGMAWQDRRQLRPALKPFAVGLGLLILLGGGTYVGTLLYQQSALKKAISETLALPRQTIHATSETIKADPATVLIVDIPVPDQYAQIVRSPDDSMNDKIPLVGLQWDVRAEADRLILSLTNCPEARYMVSLEYQKSSTVWQPLDETISTVVAEANGVTRLLTSAFYRPTQYLSKITITPNPGNCSVKLERIAGDSQLPYLFTAVLPPDWESKQLYRSFGGFGAVQW